MYTIDMSKHSQPIFSAIDRFPYCTASDMLFCTLQDTKHNTIEMCGNWLIIVSLLLGIHPG